MLYTDEDYLVYYVYVLPISILSRFQPLRGALDQEYPSPSLLLVSSVHSTE